MKRKKHAYAYPSRDKIVPRYGDVSIPISPSFTISRNDLACLSRNCISQSDLSLIGRKGELTDSARASSRVCSIRVTTSLIALTSFQQVERTATISAMVSKDDCTL